MTEYLAKATGTGYEPDEPYNTGTTQIALKATLGFHHGVPHVGIVSVTGG